MPAANITPTHLAAFTAASIACDASAVVTADNRDGSPVRSACTARLADDGHIEIRHERTFFMPGTRAHKFAVATLEAVFAALRAEGLAFRVVKYKRADLGGKPGVWHFTTSGSGLSWSVDGQWASIEILGAVAQTA